MKTYDQLEKEISEIKTIEEAKRLHKEAVNFYGDADTFYLAITTNDSR